MSEVVHVLETEIVLGRIHPRERLVEEDLCRRFSLKRHAVRQVLTELEHLGLVELRRHVGAIVRDYSLKEVIDLWALRELLERECLALIALPVPEEHLAPLREIQQEHDAAVQRNDPGAIFRVNIEFHRALFGLCSNVVLVEATLQYAQRAHAIRALEFVYPERLEKARKDHHALIDALAKGDREALLQVGHDHLLPLRDAYRQAHRYPR